MNARTWLTLGLLACLPGLMAPTAVNGSLAAFSQGTAGGATPESWGVASRFASARPSPEAPPPNRAAAPQGSQGLDGQAADSPKKQEPRAPMGGEVATGSPAGQTGEGSQGGQASQGGTSNQAEVPPNKQEPRPPVQGDASPGNAGGQGSSQEPPSGQTPAQGAQGGEPPKKQEPRPRAPADGAGEAPPSGSPSGGSRRGPPSDYTPLDPADSQYDPAGTPSLGQPIPSSCAEAGSACRQCVLSAQENIQFNRRYLHIAWSITHSHMVYAQRMIAIGDTASGLHQVTGLSWQLGAKMQIVGAVDQLRETYKRKYTDYMGHIRRSLQKLAQCEQENFATQDLYRMYGSLYYDMLQVRYEKADP